jgi:hypothetical protein
MKKQTQIIFFLLLLTGLLLPSSTALSQDADEYGYASLNMTLELEDALRGKNEVSISRTYRDIYQTHYDRLISNYENQQRHTAAEKSKKQRDIVMQYLNDRVKKAEDNEDYFNNVMFVIQAVLIDGADSVTENPPTETNPVISNFLPIHENQTKKNATDMLYGHVASNIPESGSVISSSSSQIYHVDAGLPSPSAPLAVSQNDAPTLVPTAGSVGNSSSNDVNIYKPLRFKNNGAYDVTVLPASYTPDSSVVEVGMSNASTVVFRDSSPSAYLDLPMGTYTFCYYWDLGTDVNDDGYVDYAHKNTGSVTLSEASPAKVISAQVVTLNPGNMNNPNGKCGETAPPPSGNAGGLTPQELANQGMHTYRIDCPTEELLSSEAWVTSYNFVAGGANIEDENGSWFYKKITVNTYFYDYSEIDIPITYTFTFTNEGFTLLLVGDGKSSTCTGTRR